MEGSYSRGRDAERVPLPWLIELKGVRRIRADYGQSQFEQEEDTGSIALWWWTLAGWRSKIGTVLKPNRTFQCAEVAGTNNRLFNTPAELEQRLKQLAQK